MSMKKLIQGIKKDVKESNKPISQQFLDTIDTHLIKLGGGDFESKSLKPSSYYRCMRSTFYSLMEFPKKDVVNARSQRIFRVGNALHNDIQDLLLDMSKTSGAGVKLIPTEETPASKSGGITFIKEHNSHVIEAKFKDTRYTEKYPVSAMVDGLIEFQGIQMIFEYKTCKDSIFNSLIEPSVDYIKQGAIYSLCLGIRQVLFVYINKDTQDMKCYHVTYTDAQLQWVTDRLTCIEKYLLAKELPPKEESSSCRWCSYKTICEKDFCGTEFVLDTKGFWRYKA